MPPPGAGKKCPSKGQRLVVNAGKYCHDDQNLQE